MTNRLKDRRTEGQKDRKKERNTEREKDLETLSTAKYNLDQKLVLISFRKKSFGAKKVANNESDLKIVLDNFFLTL